MKLNNKGFAITTVIYMILIIAIVLIFLTLSIFSSRKLILDKIKKQVTSSIYSEHEHNYEITSTVLPSYSGIGYNVYTCSCGDTFKKNTNTSLNLIDGLDWDEDKWTVLVYNDTNDASGMWNSLLDSKLSSHEAGLVISYSDNYGTSYTGPINLTDAKSIEVNYRLWDNYYSASGYGTNTSYFGLADSGDLENSTDFIEGKYKTLIFERNSVSQDTLTGTYNIDVSSLTGEYYFKIYTKHTISSSSDEDAYTAYTTFSSIKIKYD